MSITIMYILFGLCVHVGYCLNHDIFSEKQKAPEPLYQGL